MMGKLYKRDAWEHKLPIFLLYAIVCIAFDSILRLLPVGFRKHHFANVFQIKIGFYNHCE